MIRRDSSNTGFLTPRRFDGDLNIVAPGAVVEDLDVWGRVFIKAPNVRIRRLIIRGGSPTSAGGDALLWAVHPGADGYVVEDVTLAPTFPSPNQNGIYASRRGIFSRLNVSGTVDGVVVYGSGVEIRDSYFHDFVTYPADPVKNRSASHSDAIQIQAGVGVKVTGSTLTGALNAAVMVTQDAGTVADLVIAENVIDGGGCSINFASNGPPKTGLVIRDNRFGRGQRVANCAIIRNATASPLTESGNVWDDTGQPIVITRGA